MLVVFGVVAVGGSVLLLDCYVSRTASCAAAVRQCVVNIDAAFVLQGAGQAPSGRGSAGRVQAVRDPA